MPVNSEPASSDVSCWASLTPSAAFAAPPATSHGARPSGSVHVCGLGRTRVGRAAGEADRVGRTCSGRLSGRSSGIVVAQTGLRRPRSAPGSAGGTTDAVRALADVRAPHRRPGLPGERPSASTSSVGVPTRSVTMAWNCSSTHSCGASATASTRTVRTRSVWPSGRKVPGPSPRWSPDRGRAGVSVRPAPGAVPAVVDALDRRPSSSVAASDPPPEAVVVVPPPAARRCRDADEPVQGVPLVRPLRRCPARVRVRRQVIRPWQS